MVENKKIQLTDTIEDVAFKWGLSTRTWNGLKRSGILDIQTLVDTSDEALMRIRGLGKRSLDEIHNIIRLVDMPNVKTEIKKEENNEPVENKPDYDIMYESDQLREMQEEIRRRGFPGNLAQGKAVPVVMDIMANAGTAYEDLARVKQRNRELDSLRHSLRAEIDRLREERDALKAEVSSLNDAKDAKLNPVRDLKDIAEEIKTLAEFHSIPVRHGGESSRAIYLHELETILWCLLEGTEEDEEEWE